MKICFLGLDLPEGKVKYQDECVLQLDKKFAAQKVTPFYAEFIKDECQGCDGFIVSRERVWDLLILDLEIPYLDDLVELAHFREGEPTLPLM